MATRGIRRFPTALSGRQEMQFFAAPYRAPLRAFAALVFVWSGEDVLLCDIVDRGWCIPSGRVEAGETSLEAARREALEEGGATIAREQYIGCYRIVEPGRGEVRWADAYTAELVALGAIGMPDEARSRALVPFAEVAARYYAWNDLVAAVFDHAREVRDRARRYAPPSD